jgi:hypothetical protein
MTTKATLIPKLFFFYFLADAIVGFRVRTGTDARATLQIMTRQSSIGPTLF